MTNGSDGDARAAETLAVIERFSEAFNRQDVDAVMAAMTDDCVFDNTSPAPDGERFVGQPAVRRAWQEFFDWSPRARFETEEIFAAGDRAVVRWRYNWVDAVGVAGHVRGVDVFKVRDGKVAEKLAYVKG
jgi:ketosteroid isomerase-like protein